MKSVSRSKIALSMILALPAFAADPALLVDRGLPQQNLNNVSGTARSNVRWGWLDHGFLGDDFTIRAPGERWVIDSVRTWTEPGRSGATLPTLGDFHHDVRLPAGKDPVTPDSPTQLTPSRNQTSH